jgi:hypothetical protein
MKYTLEILRMKKVAANDLIASVLRRALIRKEVEDCGNWFADTEEIKKAIHDTFPED